MGGERRYGNERWNWQTGTYNTISSFTWRGESLSYYYYYHMKFWAGEQWPACRCIRMIQFLFCFSFSFRAIETIRLRAALTRMLKLNIYTKKNLWLQIIFLFFFLHHWNIFCCFRIFFQTSWTPPTHTYTTDGKKNVIMLEKIVSSQNIITYWPWNGGKC